jgi:hypothetical protein
MNLAADPLPERAVYELMTRKRTLALELLGDDDGFVVTLSIRAHLGTGTGERGFDDFRDFARVHGSIRDCAQPRGGA